MNATREALLAKLPVPTDLVESWCLDFNNLPIRMFFEDEITGEWSEPQANEYIEGVVALLENELIPVSDLADVAAGTVLLLLDMRHLQNLCSDSGLMDKIVAVVYQSVRNLRYAGERMFSASDEHGTSLLVVPPKIYPAPTAKD